MKQEELKEKLKKLLLTLKNNKDHVPIEELKTRYEKPYNELCNQISDMTSEYVKQIALSNIRIHRKFLHEAEPIINKTIKTSTILKQVSIAAFQHQNIEEIEQLAYQLHQLILNDLKPFYAKYVCLYLTPDCFKELSPKNPYIYNEAMGYFWENETWCPKNNIESGILLYINNKKTKIEEKKQ